jgi:AraC-like DNA-binding protein/tetratricopeptide (TPR) repeat protein
LRANLHRAVPIAELAAHAGVSERTLRDHFQRFLGMSPSGYGLRLRLNAVRHALQGRSATGSIAEVALAFGFAHPGRFSRQYHLAFGEGPATTRQAAAAGPSNESCVASPAQRGDRPEILVAPVSAVAALADLAEFLGQSISTALAGDNRIVRSPGKSMPAQRRDVSARYVIEGQLVARGDRLMIALALVDMETRTQLWGDAWSGATGQPFPAIGRAASEARNAVPPSIRKSEIARATRLRVEDMDAYRLCLRAYPLLAANTAANTNHALDLLHRAIERDPDYGFAAALAAWGHAERVTQMSSASPANELARATSLAARAATLDPDNAVVLTARSMVLSVADEREFAAELASRALARDPRLAWAWERLGWLRAFEADVQGATACFGRALRLDPKAPSRAVQLAGVSAGFFDSGRYDLAARWMRRALEVEPGAAWINRTLCVTYARMGEHRAAVQSLEELRRYRPGITVSDVINAMHFSPDFMSRIANGLSDLGLPP